MENVLVCLSRKVYEGGRQFKNKELLIHEIKIVWAEISFNYLVSL